MSDLIHVQIDIAPTDFEVAEYAFRVLLANLEATVVFHRTKPSDLPPHAVLITYSRSRIEPYHPRHLIIYASDTFWDNYGQEASLPSRPLLSVPLAALGVRPRPNLQTSLVLPYAAPLASPAVQMRHGRTAGDRSLITGADVVASTFFWISRYEEKLICERDDIGRIPEDRLTVVREKLTMRPLVDEYAELIVAWLQLLGARVAPRSQPFRVMLTHDVDGGIGVAGLRRHLDNGLRTLYRETFRQRRPFTGVVGFGQWGLRGLGVWDDTRLFRDIIEVDGEFGFSSLFFFMANGTHAIDADYDIFSEAARGVTRTISKMGGSIGLHVGLNAHNNPAQLREEWEALRSAVPDAEPISRTHYLAFFVPTTWRQLVDLGFQSDLTVGFNDRVGFRAGTCRGFRPFDVDRRVVLPIWELPMAVMDTNLFHHGYENLYERVSDAAKVTAVHDLAVQVRAHGGCLVMNWHNVHYFGHHRRVYRDILASLRGAEAVRPRDWHGRDTAVIM